MVEMVTSYSSYKCILSYTSLCRFTYSVILAHVVRTHRYICGVTVGIWRWQPTSDHERKLMKELKIKMWICMSAYGLWTGQPVSCINVLWNAVKALYYSHMAQDQRRDQTQANNQQQHTHAHTQTSLFIHI